ncbi:FdtA/QdtA family cupin domain-containing protein [Rhizobium ruizarguesonis]
MSAFTLLTLKTMSDTRGMLTVMDGILPFPIIRSFWIYGADGHKRGGHRHHETRQALVALSGSVVVSMDDGQTREDITLSSPDQCLLVEPKDWHEMTFGQDSVLLVFASHGYDKDDYIHTPYERL